MEKKWTEDIAQKRRRPRLKVEKKRTTSDSDSFPRSIVKKYDRNNVEMNQEAEPGIVVAALQGHLGFETL